MKHSAIILLLLFSITATGQIPESNVEFSGNKTLILLSNIETLNVPGKLSTGEIIRVGCDRDGCYFRIEYKDRVIDLGIGDEITKTAIYEFDFGEDGDNEIVVVNDFQKTSVIFIYSYSRGIIQELFEKEISFNRTVLKKDYIEYYKPSKPNIIWNYYQGQFWEMTPYKIYN